MEFIRGLHNLKTQTQASIVTIGNFDGLHLGHQQILQQMLHLSAANNFSSVVIIFEPHPKEYFMQGQAPPRLMPLREKLLALKEQGVDKVVCLYFDANLEKLSAQQFVQTILVQKLQMHSVCVGEDFRFGYQQQGDINLLRQLGERNHFQVIPTAVLQNAAEKISSTRIRTLLQHGQMEQATALLGRPLRLSGRVMRGDGRGRGIGFPTANINLPKYKGPLSGVYAVRARENLLGPRPLYGVANIGKRPTFGGTHDILEVYLFDFNKDIYGCHIVVEFMHKLRDEQKFSGVDALKQQIALDVEQAKAYFDSFIT